MKTPEKRIPDLRWVDEDGDVCWLTTGRDEIGDTGNIAALSIKDGDNGRESAVYVTPEYAPVLIAWLQEAVATASTREDGDR